MTYEQYMSMIPEDTQKYVEELLKKLDYYIIKDKNIEMRNNDEVAYPINKVLILSLVILEKMEKYQSFLRNEGFDSNEFETKYSPDLTKNQLKKTFEKFSNIFLYKKNIINYYVQTPIDIVLNLIWENKNRQHARYNSILKDFNLEDNFIDKLYENVKKELEESSLKIENELFKNVPVSVSNLLTTAAKIRNYFFFYLNDKSGATNEYIINDDQCLVPLSILFAIFKYDGVNKKELLLELESLGIKKEKLINKIGFNIFDYNSKAVFHAISIEKLYKKYLTGEKNNSDIDEMLILEKVFDRNFSNNIMIEKLLLSMEVDFEKLKNFRQNFKKNAKIREQEKIDSKTKDFYNVLKWDTKEFINFVTRIYILLMKKIAEGKQNSDILSCEDDADTLALYIASHFYGSELENYYVKHGVTYEKVLNLLNINITKEEIDAISLDKMTAVNKFKRFVFDGVNRNKNHEEITIADVIANLYNREFNKSKIMEDIFEKINKEIDLPHDFSRVVSNYFKQEEEDYKKEELECYFKDKPQELYDYLKEACRSYKAIISLNRKEIDENTAIEFSLLYALRLIESSDIKNFYEYLGFDAFLFNMIFHCSLSDSLKGDIDIDIIKNKFEVYIHGGRNVNKENITIEDIVKNLFNKKIYQSLYVKSILAKNNLTYEDFDDLAPKYAEYQENKKQKEKYEKIKNILSLFSVSSENLITKASSLYKKISDYKEENKIENEFLNNEDNFEALCILLAYEIEKEERTSYLVGYGITKEYLLKKFGIPNINIDEIPMDKDAILNHFDIYYSSITNNNDINAIFAPMFDKNKELFMSMCLDLNILYPYLESMIVKGIDYMQTMSIPEKIKILQSIEVEDVDVQSTSDVLVIGNDLGEHSKYINDEYSRLSKQVLEDNSIAVIDDLITQAYSETQLTKPKKGLFGFTKKEVQEENNSNVNLDALNKLKNTINEQLEELQKQIKTEDELGKYMEAYRMKNLEYISSIEENLNKIKQQISQIDSSTNYGEFLRLQTCLTALERKKESFILSDQLIKQNVASLYLSIQSLLETVIGLEISSKTLLPLIGTGVVIGKGIDIEKQARDLNRNIIYLLNSIVNKNTEGIKQGIANLNAPSDENLTLLIESVNGYLNVLEQNRELLAAQTIEQPLELPDELIKSRKM